MIERLGSDYKVMKGAVTPDHEMKSDDDTAPVLSSYTVWDRSVTLPFLHLHRSLVRLPLVSLTRLVSSSPRSGSGTEGEKDERLTDGDRSGKRPRDTRYERE